MQRKELEQREASSRKLVFPRWRVSDKEERMKVMKVVGVAMVMELGLGVSALGKQKGEEGTNQIAGRFRGEPRVELRPNIRNGVLKKDTHHSSGFNYAL